MHYIESLLEPLPAALRAYTRALASPYPNRNLVNLLAQQGFGEFWAQYRYAGGPVPCLRNLALTDKDLSGLDLSHMDMRATRLKDVSLGGADLSYSLLRQARLIGCNLNAITLVGTAMQNARATHTSAHGALYTHADTRGTSIPGIAHQAPPKKEQVKLITDPSQIPNTAKLCVLTGEHTKQYQRDFARYLANNFEYLLVAIDWKSPPINLGNNAHLIHLFNDALFAQPRPMLGQGLGYVTIQCLYWPLGTGKQPAGLASTRLPKPPIKHLR